MAMTSVRAQELLEPNKPYSYINTIPGYIMINEITSGFGLGDVSLPYSKSYIGFTTIQGYQINRNFIAGAGTGVSFYDSGTIVPLFIHIRCSFNSNPFTLFVFGEGGLLFNAKAAATLFLNPGIGIRYAINHKLGINFGTGLFILYGESLDYFISFRLGIIFKPLRSSTEERTEKEQ